MTTTPKQTDEPTFIEQHTDPVVLAMKPSARVWAAPHDASAQRAVTPDTTRGGGQGGTIPADPGSMPPHKAGP